MAPGPPLDLCSPRPHLQQGPLQPQPRRAGAGLQLPVDLVQQGKVGAQGCFRKAGGLLRQVFQGARLQVEASLVGGGHWAPFFEGGQHTQLPGQHPQDLGRRLSQVQKLAQGVQALVGSGLSQGLRQGKDVVGAAVGGQLVYQVGGQGLFGAGI